MEHRTQRLRADLRRAQTRITAILFELGDQIDEQFPTTAAAQLASGEVSDLTVAMALMIEQYQAEQDRMVHGEEPLRAADDEILETWAHRIALAQQCQREYVEAVHPIAQALFERWAASDDWLCADIGRAALTGDYRRLALP